jgi:hypothetical protein
MESVLVACWFAGVWIVGGCLFYRQLMKILRD